MKRSILFLLIVICLSVLSCSTTSPVNQLKQALDRFPEYSIILQDMKDDGNFFTTYYHRYKIVYAEAVAADEDPIYRNTITDWYEVDKEVYKENANFLGMAIASKTKESGISDVRHPPGYQYVGNSRYGNWRSDNRGGSFWEFYGKYAMLSSVMGMFSRPVYRSGWNDYRRHQSQGRPYYGPNREYGTSGSYTKTHNKSFFQRRKQRDLARRTRFSDRVGQRVRRSSMSGMRSRSSGFGK